MTGWERFAPVIFLQDLNYKTQNCQVDPLIMDVT